MTEPINDDVKEFQFEHPEKILTAEAAIARAESIVAETRGLEPTERIEFLIAKALLDAWQEGATFGGDEATAMSSRIIQRAVKAGLEEYIQKTMAHDEKS